MRKLRKIENRNTLSIILCLVFSIVYAQNEEMSFNQNKIDSDFYETENIISEFKISKNIEAKIQLIAKTENDTLFSIYIKNQSKDTITLKIQDSQLYIIQEAKDEKENWKPIEFWNYSWCGNSYENIKLLSEKIIKTESEKYSGTFKTEIRFKLLNDNEVFYSNSIICNIKTSKFLIPEEFKKNYLYRNVLRVSEEKLAEEVLFLEPNAQKEYSEKYKIWLAWITEQNRKRINNE